HDRKHLRSLSCWPAPLLLCRSRFGLRRRPTWRAFERTSGRKIAQRLEPSSTSPRRSQAATSTRVETRAPAVHRGRRVERAATHHGGLLEPRKATLFERHVDLLPGVTARESGSRVPDRATWSSRQSSAMFSGTCFAECSNPGELATLQCLEEGGAGCRYIA